MPRMSKSLQKKERLSIHLCNCEFRFPCPKCNHEQMLTCDGKEEDTIQWFVNQMFIDRVQVCNHCGKKFKILQKPNIQPNQVLAFEEVT